MGSPATDGVSGGLSIGEVARRTGIPIDTLRFYDRMGLLGDLPRTVGGHRVFDDAALGLLDLVVRLRRSGMPIDDVRAFVDLVRANRDVSARIALLRRHRERVLSQLDQLGRDLEVIEWKIAAYTAVEKGAEPPPPPPGWPNPSGALAEPDGLARSATRATAGPDAVVAESR
jgi:Predicted transcriptional regulators